ncbi:unnamed protein product [Lepeophtheirus salmonis]|uniref:(salmon louse) hypothetical protein n=1 Tax=Lepeophtheirus salmonis TaxID=72036 RepID=A0A7R8CNB9_LEPSM|nr:unnamed protein product [Lepeophtheirus salmonis]CAF2840616.1 unnamed protein product [Lepeophtheirus salmonis]
MGRLLFLLRKAAFQAGKVESILNRKTKSLDVFIEQNRSGSSDCTENTSKSLRNEIETNILVHIEKVSKNRVCEQSDDCSTVESSFATANGRQSFNDVFISENGEVSNGNNLNQKKQEIINITDIITSYINKVWVTSKRISLYSRLSLDSKEAPLKAQKV